MIKFKIGKLYKSTADLWFWSGEDFMEVIFFRSKNIFLFLGLNEKDGYKCFLDVKGNKIEFAGNVLEKSKEEADKNHFVFKGLPRNFFEEIEL